jgi:hypothetical protein
VEVADRWMLAAVLWRESLRLVRAHARVTAVRDRGRPKGALGGV